MRETARFINEGYGWTCKRCRGRDADAAAPSSASTPDTLPRFFREGEAEDRDPRLSSSALARWRDSARTALVCPRCGAEEEGVSQPLRPE